MNIFCVIRWLRIGWMASLGIVGVFLVVLWLRSYRWVDSVVLPTTTNAELDSWSGIVTLRISTNRITKASNVWKTGSFSPRFTHVQSPGPNLGFEYLRQGPKWELRCPHFSLVALPVVMAVAPCLRWRFSLRTLLLATTLVAIALGLIATVR